jgi:GntR family transcriptional regulator
MRRGRGAVVTDAAAPLSQLHDDVLALSIRARDLGLSPDMLAALVKEIAREH